MAQGILNFEYFKDESKSGMTALGGLPVYMDFAVSSGLLKLIDENLKICSGNQGWTDREIVFSMILLNLVGGDSVKDIDRLEGDDGLCRIMRQALRSGLTRKERRQLQKRFRKERKRTTPSESVIFRYLSKFHDKEQEKMRVIGKAFIPEATENLKALMRINTGLIGFEAVKPCEEIATLDMDATLSETTKRGALYSYEGEKAYQPLNTYWHERDILLHTEFRDGNVPAGYEQQRVLEEALKCLPQGVRKVRLRSDSAGYQHDLMRYCAEGANKRFGRIEFAISCDVTKAFREAVKEVSEEDWHPMYKEVNGELRETGREYAEVCFVPNRLCHSKSAPTYRYLATRREIKDRELPGMEKKEEELPFPTVMIKNSRYKIFGYVTNMDWSGDKLIAWVYGRCGKSEQAHDAVKNDFAGGHFPSGDFGENAAWWWITVLAHNFNVLMKRMILGQSWINKRMKAIRLGLIFIAGRVIERSRKMIISISGDHPSWSLLIEVRRKIAQLACAP